MTIRWLALAMSADFWITVGKRMPNPTLTLDVMVEEPLPAASPLWAMEHVLITPHTAGETCRYEDNVLAIMQENLARLWRGETELLNQVV